LIVLIFGMVEMGRLTFDLDVLRSFTLGIELGSFARAADRLGRSTSAVSAQLKKLEEQVGAPVVRKAGRGVALTPIGETVLAYARRLLELNDEAAGAIRGAELAGTVRIGLQQDFGEDMLADILGDFARAHPNVHIEAQTARNRELIDGIVAGRLDLALAWGKGELTAHHRILGELPMQWVGSANGMHSLRSGEALPLVCSEAPCLLRTAGCDALDRAGVPWRVTFTSLGLGSIWAAVGAGLGVTVRTRAGLPSHLQVLDGLPPLPEISLVLHHAEADQPPVVQRLAEIVEDRLRERLPEL
jgi:DNA-binding transcriptional LysR family regulator